MHDHVTFARGVPCLPPQVASTTQTGAGVDRVGCNAVKFALDIGAGGITFSGTNKIEFSIEHSDDNTTFAACAASDVILGVNCDAAISNGIFRSLIAAKAAEDVTIIGYRGSKRYIRIKATFSGTHGTGTAMSAVAILSELDLAPYVP